MKRTALLRSNVSTTAALFAMCLSCPRPARAESGEAVIFLVEGIFALIAAGSAGAMAETHKGANQAPRIAGAIEIGYATLGFVGEAVHPEGMSGFFAGIAALGGYNLALGTVPNVHWRFAINDAGLNAALVGGYFYSQTHRPEPQPPPPPARILAIPGGLALAGRF